MKKAKQFISAMALCTLVLVLCSCAALNKVANEESYNFGSDSIPSVYSVIGERKVTGVESGTGTDGQYKEYTYETEDALGDIQAYIDELQNQGWVITINEGGETTGTVQLGNESADDGMILLLTIEYDGPSYVLNATKQEGTLNRYE